jgi:hypothetical protein
MRSPAFLLVASCLVVTPASAQDTLRFVTRLGNDTVAVERYTRVGDRIEGRQVIRAPQTAVKDYRMYLRPDGSVGRWEFTSRTPTGEVAWQSSIDFRGDSALIRFRQGGTERTRRVAAPYGSVPWLIYSPAVYEPAIAYARRSGTQPLKAGMVTLGGSPYPLEVRVHGDTAEVTNVAGENRVQVDAQGRVVVFDARTSTEHYLAERVPSLNMDSLTASFAARDTQGRGLGSLTPLDSVKARFGDAELSVRYSRPYKRGRKIFGSLLPWGKVWRTGANDATAFSTTRDLVIGGVAVPAGSYTLYSIPSPTQWQLIINRQTGQFGTEYHPEQDLARIPMTREALDTPVEQFTISLEPGGAGGRLVLTWDDTRAWVPVQATPRRTSN